MLEKGIEKSLKMVVAEKDTAKNYMSGKLEVYATPAMVAFMEKTACACVEDYLETGTDTVGIQIDVKHLKASKLGAEIDCKARLTEINGRKLTFALEANDEQGLIGTAIHKRYIIKPEKFLSKL